jgi:hypothetical protein
MDTIISPKTQRHIKLNSTTYKTLLKDGWFNPFLPNDIISLIYSYIPISCIKNMIINKYTNELLSTKHFWQHKNNEIELFKNYKRNHYSLKECVNDYYNQYHIELVKNVNDIVNIFVHKNVIDDDYKFLYTLSNKSIPKHFEIVPYNLIHISRRYNRVTITISNKDKNISVIYHTSIISCKEFSLIVLNHYRGFNIKMINDYFFTLS